MAVHRRRRWMAALIALLVVYVASYLVVRQTQQQVWARDGRTYVIFPEGFGRVLYYPWRPLSYADQALRGMRSHIGPHRE